MSATFYKLKLNLCFEKQYYNHFPVFQNRAFNNVELLNFDSLLELTNKKINVRILSYYQFFWKLHLIKYFFMKIKWKKIKNIILLVAESSLLFNIMVFFCKQFNQQYILGWFQGLITNRKMIQSYIHSINLFHLYYIVQIPSIIIFIENVSYLLQRAMIEVFNHVSSLPVTFFSVNDLYLSEVHFFTTKSESKVYFYIEFCFSLLFKHWVNANVSFKPTLLSLKSRFIKKRRVKTKFTKVKKCFKKTKIRGQKGRLRS